MTTSISVEVHADEAIYAMGVRKSLLEKALHEAVKAGQKAGMTDLGKITRTWQHKPAWSQELRMQPRGADMAIWTDDEEFGYLERGTVPHIIQPMPTPMPIKTE